MFSKLTTRIAQEKIFQSWTWNKCKICAYILAVIACAVAIFVILPLVFYS